MIVFFFFAPSGQGKKEEETFKLIWVVKYTADVLHLNQIK